jgi:hypothetical protein
MKMQLSQNTTTNIAKNPQAYSAPQQRQGTFVERPLRDLVEAAKVENPKLANAFNSVSRKIRALQNGLKIDLQFIDSIETLTEIDHGHLPELINEIHFLRTLDRDGNLLGICLLSDNPQDADTLLEGLWRNLDFLKSGLPNVIRKLNKRPR